jgi:general secretion pathway protein D
MSLTARLAGNALPAAVACVVGASASLSVAQKVQDAPGREAAARVTSLAGVASIARLVDLVAARFGIAITYDEASLNVGRIVIRKEQPLDDDSLWLLTNRLLGEQGLCIVRGADGATYAVTKIPTASQTVLAEDVDLASFVPGRLVRDAGGRPMPGFRKVMVRLSRTSTKDAAAAVQFVLSRPAGSVAESEAAGLLVIADLTPYVDAALAMLADLERTGGGASVEEFPVRNLDPARAAVLAKQLAEKLKAAGGRELRGEILPGAVGERGAGSVMIIAPAVQQDEWKRLLARLDTRESVERRTYSVRSFGLAEVASLIERTVGAAWATPSGPGGGAAEDARLRLISDELTGSLIVDATPGQHAEIEALLARLESAPGETRRPVRTFKIRNRPVKEMQQLLSQLLRSGVFEAGVDRAAVSEWGLSPEGSAAQTSARPLVPGGAPAPTLPGGGGPGGAGTPSLQFASGVRSPSTPAASRAGNALEVALTLDEATNTLIAVGESRVLAQIEALLPTLDVRQPQVMLEAFLVSLNDAQSLDFGVELERLRVSGETFIKLSSLFGLSTAGSGGGVRNVPDRTGFAGSVLNPGEFSIILRAVEGVSKGRSLSSPKVLVGNNQQATFNSVLQQPFASTNASNTVATTAFGGTQDAGTTISVQPQIAEGDHLVLTYSVSLSAFVGAATNPNLPPPRQQNSVSSVSTIPDGYTVVVGGLETTTEGDSETKVPVVGSIPLVGELFKNRSRTSGRTRFFVFLRASVLRGVELEELRHLSINDAEAARLGPPDGAPEVQPRIVR